MPLCETLASLRSADRCAAPPPGGLAEVGAPIPLGWRGATISPASKRPPPTRQSSGVVQTRVKRARQGERRSPTGIARRRRAKRAIPSALTAPTKQGRHHLTRVQTFPSNQAEQRRSPNPREARPAGGAPVSDRHRPPEAGETRNPLRPHRTHQTETPPSHPRPRRPRASSWSAVRGFAALSGRDASRRLALPLSRAINASRLYGFRGATRRCAGLKAGVPFRASREREWRFTEREETNGSEPLVRCRRFRGKV